MLAKPEAQVLQPFLNPKVTLVPAPRSAPLAQGALWPAKVIADILAGGGYGSSVLPAIDRVTAVKKSSSSSKAAGRPLIHEHVASMRVNPGGGLFPPEQITIVDDVLTMGRMSAACAELLRCAYPEAEIRMFAMIRTQGMVENIDKIFDPSVGVITAYDSGKSHREP
ncbi:MAG: hypothetical protein GY807_06050 [Gammaproteobacteria bacterium]|nr:hypothetical protein [Gammaproteobacteria bacterium]